MICEAKINCHHNSRCTFIIPRMLKRALPLQRMMLQILFPPETEIEDLRGRPQQALEIFWILTGLLRLFHEEILQDLPDMVP